jgi:hypothetical protein
MTAVDRIARAAWEADGKPDGHEPTEANIVTYEGWTRTVLRGIEAAGYRVVRVGR